MTLATVARHHAGCATGLLGWTPDQFWQSTPPEFLCAWRAFARHHGLAEAAPAGDAALITALMRQFPDEDHP